ncbi:MAG: RND family transporter [Christensenellales bacterium]
MKVKNVIAKFIVHIRYYLLALFVLLLVGSCILIPQVKLNYDLTKYLEEGAVSRADLLKMTEEFGEYGNLNVMLCGVTKEQAATVNEKILELDCVTAATFDGSESCYKDGNALIAIFLNVSSFDPDIEVSVNQIREVVDATGFEYKMNGSAITQVYYSEHMTSDMLVILALAAVVIIAMLLLSSKAYIEPLIVGIVLLTAILINMGTNFFMGEICFITNAICAVLQLALSMDYSIVLLHRYEEEKEHTLNAREALERALAATFVPILSSSLTTMAGLLALVFMKFKIGFDIGMVLTKSILISLLTVFLLMPALIMLFNKPIEKTSHKPIRFKYNWLATYSKKTKIVVPIVLVVVVVVGGVLNFMSSYSYTLKTSSKANAAVNVENQEILDTYGQNTPFIIMIPNKEDGSVDYQLQNTIIDSIMNVETDDGEKIITSAQSLSTYKDVVLTKEQLKKEYGLTSLEIRILWDAGGFSGDQITLGDLITLVKTERSKENSAIAKAMEGKSVIKLLDMLDNGKYSRIVFTMDCGVAEEKSFDVSYKIRQLLESEFSETETYFIGESIVYYDIRETYNQDSKNINVISLVAIILLVALAFMSVSVPVILMTIIQGSIWINFSINTLANDPIFFVSYLVVMCIQMGATIDYGILMTSSYIEHRKTKGKQESLRDCLYSSLPTVFTSGSILIIAPLLVGIFSNIAVISEIGYLLCRGCLVSVVMIVFTLPQILLLCDKLIQKTSYKCKLYEDAK